MRELDPALAYVDVMNHTVVAGPERENRSPSTGFDARETLVLHRVGFRDAGRLRPLVHRALIENDHCRGDLE